MDSSQSPLSKHVEVIIISSDLKKGDLKGRVGTERMMATKNVSERLWTLQEAGLGFLICSKHVV